MKIRLNKTVAAVASSALVLLAIPTFGLVAGANASTKPTYIIGYEGPLSGPDAYLGQYMKWGIKLAINNANASGKLPFKLQVKYYDDQGSQTLSPAQAQAAVANTKVVAMVGPAFSGATRAAEPFYAVAGMATVSPSATAAALATGITNNNFMRVVYGDDVQGAADAKFLAKTKALKKILVIDDGSFYGAGLAQVVAANAKTDGASVTTNSLPETSSCGGLASSTEYTSAAASIASANPDAVFYGGYYCDFGLFLSALKLTSYQGQIMSGDGSESAALITGTSPATAANGVWLSASGGGSNRFTGKLEQQFEAISGGVKSSAVLYSTQAYDATSAIIKAMSSIKWSNSLQLNRIAITNALHKLSFRGVTGPIKFQTNGDLYGTGAGQVNFYQIQSGVITQVGHN